jgi:hypothetical protein
VNTDSSGATSGNRAADAPPPRTSDANPCPHSLTKADNERAAVSPLRCVDCDTRTGTNYVNH